MLNARTAVVILVIGCCLMGTGFAQDQTAANPAEPQEANSVAPQETSSAVPQQTLEEDWNDFLHYVMIGRFDLAKGYAQAILQGKPDPVDLFELVRDNPKSYDFATSVAETAEDKELADLSRQLLGVIDQGRFEQRTDPNLLVDEVGRLGGTLRGKLTAIQRLRDAGEYSVPYLLDAMAEAMRQPAGKNDLTAMIEALPQIGQPAIRPLGAALQMNNDRLEAEIIRALGQIGYPQALPYLKYVVEKAGSTELRNLAADSIRRIDPRTANTPAAALFFQAAEKYYYHNESLNPPQGVSFANIWFWDPAANRVNRVEVASEYFHELMCMQCCEWSLKADEQFGLAIGLWLAAFFKAEATGVAMPAYFGEGHASALVYATTAGPEYLHQALARAVNDRTTAVALGAVEALATTAGEKSLMYTLGPSQPLLQALTYPDRAVRYSAAIAIASAGPRQPFGESGMVIQNLAEALARGGQSAAAQPAATGQGGAQAADQWTPEVAEAYALRAAQTMLRLAVSRNPVINLAQGQAALINATKDARPEIRTLAGQILAYVNSPGAQRAIAEVSLNSAEEMNVRVAAFNSLIDSAKLNGNLLPDAAIAAIYELISKTDTDPALRAAAAAAYGSLNLPSQKVKDLILDQAKS